MGSVFQDINLLGIGGVAVSVVIGLVALLVVRALTGLVGRADPVDRRLSDVQGVQTRGRVRAGGLDLRTGLASLITKLSKGGGEGRSWEKSKIRLDLARAGFRSPESIAMFIALRTVVAVVMAAVGAAGGIISGKGPVIAMGAGVMGAALGYLAPGYFLQKKAEARGKTIIKELPGVLDLLVIAVEAGLGLDSAFRRVSAELSASCPVLAEEMVLLTLELQLGVGREEGLRNMARRCGVDEIGSLAAMLIQADRFGVSVGRSLRVYSDEIRTKRRQQMEEAAAKIPLKLLFPVLFLIFPAIMAVMAGPALVGIMDSMF